MTSANLGERNSTEIEKEAQSMDTNRTLILSLTAAAVLLFGGLCGSALAQVLYNGPASSTDLPVASAVDGNGNLYVTGKSFAGVGAGYDIVTIKYSSNGTQVWAARYVGPGKNDIPYAIAVDGSGNVYVTGASQAAGFNGDTAFDYVTIRYSAVFVPVRIAGILALKEFPHQDWAQRYAGIVGRSVDVATAIAVSGSSVYVTGNSGAAIATIAYDAATGSELWESPIRRDSDSWPVGIAVSFDGDVYLAAGWGSILTLRYSAAGEELDVGIFEVDNSNDAVALVVRGDFVYVFGKHIGGDGSVDFVTIKYDLHLNEEWHDIRDSFGGTDTPSSMVVDSLGRVYVAGSCQGNHSEVHTDFWVQRYTADGALDTFWFYDGTPGSDGRDYVTDLAIDGADNVYVTGSSLAPNSQFADFVTLKLNAGGLFYRWTRRYAAGAAYPAAMAIDGNGNIFVTGYTQVAGQGTDILTLKYSPAGAFLW
jgi:uncharacterized delta-60 repeat protein